MSDLPLAYHITFGTYGTRLHGDPRGTVDRGRNRPGDPIVGENRGWQRMERGRMRFAPVALSQEQRVHVEAALPAVCSRGGWELHVGAAQADHVHVVLTSPNDGQVIRRVMKRWLSEALSERWPPAKGRFGGRRVAV